MKKIIKKVVNIVVNILVVLILMVSLIIVMLSLTSNSSGVPNIFGIAPLSVQTGSMEDTLNPGDLILCELTEIDDEFQKGDIVTFPIEIDGEKVLNTHRIVEVVEKDNDICYRTQGDNKETNPEPDEDLQTASTIVAKYTGTKIGGFGYVLSYLRTQLGFFLCVLLPMILFFVYEAVRVVINIVAYNKEKAIESAQAIINSSVLTEEQKKRAIEEYLASQGGNIPQDTVEETSTDDVPTEDVPTEDNSTEDNSTEE